MIHNLISFALVAALAVVWWLTEPGPAAAHTRAALARVGRWATATVDTTAYQLGGPARMASWWAAGRRWRRALRRATRTAWVAGADITAGLAAAAQVEDERPPCGRCRGRRCWYARNGLECPAPAAPKLTDTLGGPGLHECAAALRRWVPPDWSPLPRRLRHRLAPTAWSARMGVPPLGVLP